MIIHLHNNIATANKEREVTHSFCVKKLKVFY